MKLLLFVACGLAFAQPGTFTNTGADNNTVMVYAVTSETNTCDPTADYQTTQGGAGVNFAAIGAAGCVGVPSTSTNQGAVGVQGSIQNASTKTNAVAGYFPAIAAAAGTGDTDPARVRIWGFNPVVWDSGFQHVLMTNELDFHITGAGNKILGLQLTGGGTADMSADSAGYLVGPLGGHKWPVAFYCTDGSSAVCYVVGTLSSGNNTASAPVRFVSRTAGGTNNTGDIILSPVGGFQFAESAGAGWVFQNTVGGVLTTQLTIQGGGGITQNQGTVFAGLSSAFPNGSYVYCPDCTNASNPCVGGGTGAFAKRLGGAWDCR